MKKIVGLILIVVLIVLIGFWGLKNKNNSLDNNLDDLKESNISKEEVVTDKEVSFEDKEFESAIREILQKPEGEILVSDMENVHDVNLKESNVTDLTGLEYAKNLTSFSISKTNIKDLKPLKELKKLERLTIRYMELEDPILKFDKDINLSYVLIIETNINDLSFLDGMTNLTSINVSRSGVSNISYISKAINLESVSFPDNDITDLSALKGKTKITSLNLQGNENLTNIESLKDLAQLEDLTLSYTAVINLKPLEELSNLKELRIYKNHDVKHLIFDEVTLFENKGIAVYYHK